MSLDLFQSARARSHHRPDGISGNAMFNRNGKYRYWLTRSWNPGGKRLVIIGLNPSKADRVKDDPTIRKCVAFAKLWGFGHLCMLNMFAYVATDPKVMYSASRPIGRDNDYWLRSLGDQADMILAAWGEHGKFIERVEQVMAFMPPMHALFVNKDGSPRHPLYVPYAMKPLPYETKAF